MLKRITINLAFLVTASTVLSGHDPSVAILVTSAKQDCPVQIKGFKLPQKVGDPPLLVVHNATEKEVLVFYVAGQVGNPRGIEGSDPKVGIILGGEPTDSIKEPQVAPNGDSEVPDKLLRSHNIAIRAKSLDSNCLHVAVLVTKVQFSDGTVWEDQAGREVNQDLWRNSIRPESTKPCENSQQMEEALKQLDGAGYRESGRPTNAGSELVQFYTVTCPFQKHEEHLDAICTQ